VKGAGVASGELDNPSDDLVSQRERISVPRPMPQILQVQVGATDSARMHTDQGFVALGDGVGQFDMLNLLRSNQSEGTHGLSTVGGVDLHILGGQVATPEGGFRVALPQLQNQFDGVGL